MLNNIYKVWLKSLLVFMFFAEIYSLQRFIELPEYTEVNPGEDALLKCRIMDKKGSCSWQKDNKPVGTHKNKYEWANEDSPSGDCSLWVRQATLQLDDGQWQCQVTASSFDLPDALSSAPAALAVRVAPQAPKILFNGSGLMPGENITVQAGSRATVVCEARYGNPPAAISWFMDKESLSAWSQTNTSEVERPRVWASRSVLELGAARGAHGRTLACRAAHASYPPPGHRDAYALLDVTYVPVVSILGTDSSLTKLEEGSGVVSLECRADGNPKPYVWWTKDGQIIQSTGTKLILAPISRNHSGIYSCQARNNLGSSEPVKVEIDVKYPPRVIWVGPDMVVEANLFSKVVLECKAEGNPKPHYQWLHSPNGVHQDKNSLPTGYVVSNDAQFVLPNVTYKQQGLYYCVAVNHIAYKERSHQADPVTLNVIGPPLGLENEGVDGWLGKDVEIYVDVCADPPPRKATWLWGSLRLNVPSTVGRYRSADMTNEGGCYRYNLFIQETIKQDARIYILQVENERGSTTHAVTLTLHESAKIAPLVGIVFLAAAILVVIICLLRRCRQKKETVQYKSSDLEPEKTEAIPADAIYSAKMYSPDALKDAYSTLANNAKENIYAVLDPHMQYDLTISRHGSQPTHLSLRRPLQQPSERQIRKSQRSSESKRSKRRASKPRPKSLQAFDSPRYLDHVFPDGVEL